MITVWAYSFQKVLHFTQVEFLQQSDFFLHLWGKRKVIIPAIFSDHSVGIEYGDIKKDVIDAFINVSKFFGGGIEFLEYFREQLIK